jgi:hypothetical protein
MKKESNRRFFNTPNTSKITQLNISALLFLITFLTGPIYANTWAHGDLNGNYKVDTNDLRLFIEQWLDTSGCSGLGCADFDSQNGVNMTDIAMLAKNMGKKLLFINEVMAANDKTLQDPQEPGEYPDWIEIYNASDQRIYLGGLYLTDNKDVPNKFLIPGSVYVDANSFVVFIADNETAQGSKHTNFKIKADGDDIYLFSTNAVTLIDGIEFGQQVSDISYGRYPNGNDNWRFMGYPTPGTQNNGGYLGMVEDTKFSVDRGFYNSPFQVRIASDTDGATVRYTTDGKDPIDPNGTVYYDSTPIQITKTTCLRARATKAGWLPSNTDTQTYIFISDIINQPATRPDANWPLPGQSSATNYQLIDYEMDPDVTTNPSYADLMDDALLAIPSISIVTDLKNLFNQTAGIYVNCGDYGSNPNGDPGWLRGDAWKRPVSVELINPDGSKGFQINAGLGMRGVTSCSDNNPKHAFRLFFENRFGGGPLNYPLFGSEGANSFDRVDLRCEQNYSWNFASCAHNTAVREVFCRDLLKAMDEPTSLSRYYHLYINGVYWGLYQTDERPESNYGKTYFSGNNDDYDTVKPNRSWPRSMEVVDGNFAAYKRLWQACKDGFETDLKYFKVQGQNTNGTPNPAYERLVDANNLIDFMLSIFYTGDFDGPISSWYGDRIPNNFFGLYNRVNPDGFKYFRHDGEHTLGIISNCTVGDTSRDRTGPYTASDLMNFIEGCPVQPWASQICIGFNPQTIHQYLTVHPEYKLHFADRVQKFFFNNGPMTVTGAQNLFMSRAVEIDSAIIAESARWGSASLTKSQWLTAISWVADTYMPVRTGNVITQFKNEGWFPNVDAPVFYINGSPQHGGLLPSPPDSLTMTATAGTIYYTLDGTDPRTPLTGAIHGTEYTDACSLSQPTKVMARAQSGGVWSALSEAVYDIGVVKNNLRISEIMYHPSDAPAGDPNAEFIELKNIGSSSINLRWTQFTKGIHFTFPNVSLSAGSYIVVVKDTAAFTAEYGGGINIAGQYTGSLDNNGERIRLEDAIGETILDFDYKDGWRNITDGDGYSLTINDETNADLDSWAKQDSWSASTNFSGSPGAADTGPRWGDVVINEVLAHQDSHTEDWIELHNTTASPINITGFFLSDSDSNLTKYQIPSTTIPANGYVVFTEKYDFGSYFAFSENGETAYLTGKKDGNGSLTGYRQKEDFGASQKDVSFGRHLKSTGTYNFAPMSAQTPDAANAYPKVGPIIISEIMYHPEKFWGDWNAEYIELYNTSGSTVNLYDANGLGWKITSGINYIFPNGTSLASHSYLLLVKNTVAFYNQYGSVPGGVQIFQWTSGRLDNDGEQIEISMPGDIDEGGQQQYIRIDRVTYSNGSHPENFDGVTDPWSVYADGQGYSLTKVNYALYGNDPNAWAAYSPSPGQAGSPPTPPSKATSPNPSQGATGRPLTQTLSWANGGGATSYDVYFGTDSTPDETEFKTNTTGTSYNPGTLLSTTTYYWRINAKNFAGTTTGDVWNFTTVDFFPIDNFEQYTATGHATVPTPVPSGTLRKVWIDGRFYTKFTLPSSDPNYKKVKSGSYAQLSNDPCDGKKTYAHYQPGNIVISGTKSMKLYYDNDGTVTWDSDLYGTNPSTTTCTSLVKYSEVRAAIDNAARITQASQESLGLTRNWSSFQTLKISFYGDPNNTLKTGSNAENLWVGLADGSDMGNPAVVYYSDVTKLKISAWQNWSIPLSDFTTIKPSLNLANIARIHIGIGNRASPPSSGGGTGIIFIDDIELRSE